MNLVFLGPPGAGKGTQADILKQKCSLFKISTGDLFRDAVQNNAEEGMLAKTFMDKGLLVPDNIVLAMVKKAIESITSNYKGFILDGFPRNLSQAKELDKMLLQINKNIDAVLNITVDHDLIVDRISKRFVCKSCKASYNSKFKPCKNFGMCDECGSKDFLHREDDKEEIVRNRLIAYEFQNKELEEFYKTKGLLSNIDGSQESGTVSTDIFRIINHLKVA